MKRKNNLLFVLGAASYLFLLMALLPAVAQEEPAVVTQQQIQTGDGVLKYAAETGRIAIRDVETGTPHGRIFYIAYSLPSAPGETRPVTFVWNGGPGSNSAFLHFNVVGPKRAEGDRLIDNAETWLTFTDLVFVDPIGTGFSRPDKAEYASEFYGTLGDTASVTEFVRSWRLLHEADDAPLFLVGESWGAPRAATVGYALEKRGIRVDGLVLISGGSGLNTAYVPPELKAALRVVDMSFVAFHHGRTSPALGKDFATIRKIAESWARQTYAPALARVDGLSDAERTAVINELSRFTGLAPELIDRKTLVITPNQFRNNLLKDQGLILGTFDMRQTVKTGTSSYSVAFEAGPAIVRYLRRDLGYRTDLPYLDLENIEQGFAPSGKYPPSVNEVWNYATAEISPEDLQKALSEAARRGDGPPQIGSPLPATGEAIALNPHLKVLVVSGLFDSYATCMPNEEVARRLPPALQKAITFKSYVGGHMMYLDTPSRLQFTHDVKAMIASVR